MRKAVTGIWAALSLCIVSNAASGAASDHLQDLKSKFPYGLIGDDYGILTTSDLALNACRIKPKPFVPGELSPYEYWQCFESKFISAACENVGVTDEDGVAGRVVVIASESGITHRFIEPRSWPVRDCRGFVKDLKTLMKGASHACISASYIGNEVDESNKKEPIGILGRVKTRKGCEGEVCELTEKRRREYCPEMKT